VRLLRYEPAEPMRRDEQGTFENGMPKATWNGAVLAEAADDEGEIVMGSVYFPPDALNDRYLQPSETHTGVPLEGTASYYHVVVDGKKNRDAAWYYAEPSAAASQIKDRVAFWRGSR
jgi:uncharacterized protein (DUF427 family)